MCASLQYSNKEERTSLDYQYRTVHTSHYSTVQYSKIHYSTIQYTEYSIAVQYSTLHTVHYTQYSTVHYIQYTQYMTVIVQYSTVHYIQYIQLQFIYLSAIQNDPEQNFTRLAATETCSPCAPHETRQPTTKRSKNVFQDLTKKLAYYRNLSVGGEERRGEETIIERICFLRQPEGIPI